MKTLIILIVGLATICAIPGVGQDIFDPENEDYGKESSRQQPHLEIKPIRVIVNPVFDRTDLIRIIEHPRQQEVGFIGYDVFQTDNSIYYTMTPMLTPAPPTKSPSVVFSGESGTIFLHFVYRDLNDTSTIRIQYTIDSANTVRFRPSLLKGGDLVELVTPQELPVGALWIQLGDDSKGYRKLRAEVKGLSEGMILNEGFYQNFPLEVYKKDGRNRTDLGWLLVLKPEDAKARDSILSLRVKYDIFRQVNRR